jgi:hypothetical protein
MGFFDRLFGKTEQKTDNLYGRLPQATPKRSVPPSIPRIESEPATGLTESATLDDLIQTQRNSAQRVAEIHRQRKNTPITEFRNAAHDPVKFEEELKTKSFLANLPKLSEPEAKTVIPDGFDVDVFLQGLDSLDNDNKPNRAWKNITSSTGFGDKPVSPKAMDLWIEAQDRKAQNTAKPTTTVEQEEEIKKMHGIISHLSYQESLHK